MKNKAKKKTIKELILEKKLLVYDRGGYGSVAISGKVLNKRVGKKVLVKVFG